MANSVNESIETMFSKMEDFVTTKTVVGEAITVGDVIMLPLVDLSFGLGAANGEGKDKTGGLGGGGLGAKMEPSAVLVVSKGNVQLVNIKNQDSINKLIDMAPGVVAKISSFFKDKKEKKNEGEDEADKLDTEE